MAQEVGVGSYKINQSAVNQHLGYFLRSRGVVASQRVQVELHQHAVLLPELLNLRKTPIEEGITLWMSQHRSIALCLQFKHSFEQVERLVHVGGFEQQIALVAAEGEHLRAI